MKYIFFHKTYINQVLELLIKRMDYLLDSQILLNLIVLLKLSIY